MTVTAAQREANARYREKNRDSLRAKARAYSQRWRTDNPERHAESLKEWREKSPEHIRAYSKAYYTRNADRLRLKSRKSYSANPGRWRSYARAYYQLMRERCLEYASRYARTNRSRIRDYWRGRRAANPGAFRELWADWAHRNPDKVRARNHSRRSRLAAAEGTWTHIEWKALKAKYDYRCLRCGRKEPEIKLTVDHVVPISLHGPNTIDNIQPLCGPCNSAKHAKAVDFRYERAES